MDIVKPNFTIIPFDWTWYRRDETWIFDIMANRAISARGVHAWEMQNERERHNRMNIEQALKKWITVVLTEKHKLQARVIECGVGIPARDWPSWSGSIVWIISCSRPCRNFAWLSREWEDGPPWACSQPCPEPVPPPLPPTPLLLPTLLLHPASPGAGMLPHAPDVPPTLVSLLLIAFGCCWNTQRHFSIQWKVSRLPTRVCVSLEACYEITIIL